MLPTSAIRDMPDGASFVATPSFVLAQTIAARAADRRHDQNRELVSPGRSHTVSSTSCSSTRSG